MQRYDYACGHVDDADADASLNETMSGRENGRTTAGDYGRRSSSHSQELASPESVI